MLRTLVVTTVLVLACVLPVAGLQPTQVSALPSPSDPGPDFNGDGFADLAVGVPGEDPHGISLAGSVHVIYGSAHGLDGNHPVDDQLWSQEQTGISGVGERADFFGEALASGDFDGDGFDDLAIGVPSEDLVISAGQDEESLNVGAVHILYGTPSGLTATGQRLITEDTAGVPGAARPGDRFGDALAAGDMGRTSQDDLAIGAPGVELEGPGGGGKVIVLYGAPVGLNGSHDAQFWNQDSPGIPGSAEAGDRFGGALLTADLAGSAQADLVIGIPGESQGSLAYAGAVEIILSSPTGLQTTGAQVWTQDSAGVLGVAEAGDGFGTSLTAGDFDNDGRNDLAIGSPGEDVVATNAGAVNVLYGSPSGIGAGGDPQLWFQGSPGIQEDPEKDDNMGAALAAGDFNGDGYDDLAIGAPGERAQIFGQIGAGAVNEIKGSASGLSANSDSFWSQDSEGFDGAIEDSSETDDRFGSSLLAADFGRVVQGMDLAIGVPGETQEHSLGFDDEGAGAVNVLYGGGPRGLNQADDDQFWWEAADSLHESADPGDEFGTALAH
jgi:hypothetical protein